MGLGKLAGDVWVLRRAEFLVKVHNHRKVGQVVGQVRLCHQCLP